MFMHAEYTRQRAEDSGRKRRQQGRGNGVSTPSSLLPAARCPNPLRCPLPAARCPLLRRLL
jgi:hypothetical protein